MADGTKIQWTESTWNPMTGCTKVSPGCDNCYAETFAERWRGTPGHYFEHGFDIQPRFDKLELPLRWNRPRRIFVNSMSDLFHPEPTNEFIADVFGVMALAGQHTFQLLTKRHGRMRSLLKSERFYTAVLKATGRRDARAVVGGEGEASLPWPLPNLWLGVSVEDQHWADVRVPVLLDTPATVRWLSCEPLLGPVDLHCCAGVDAIQRDWIGGPGGGTGAPHPLINWCVVGGESGPSARPMDLDWARTIVADCRAAGVPVFIKQLGSVWAKANGADSKGGNWDLWPEDLRVREYPAVAEAVSA